MPQLAIASVMALTVLIATNVEAQWLNYPTPGIPRLADGKPDLPLADRGFRPDLAARLVRPRRDAREQVRPAAGRLAGPGRFVAPGGRPEAGPRLDRGPGRRLEAGSRPAACRPLGLGDLGPLGLEPGALLGAHPVPDA